MPIAAQLLGQLSMALSSGADKVRYLKGVKVPIWSRAEHVRIAPDSRLGGGVRSGQLLTCSATEAQWLAPLLDHLVGGREQGLWNHQPKCFRGFDADQELKLIRLLDWQICRVRSPQNAINIIRRPDDKVVDRNTIRHQTAFRDERRKRIHRRQAVLARLAYDQLPMSDRKGVWKYQ